MEAEGIDPAKIFMYGHSLGARMVIDAAIKFGTQKIGMIDGEGSDWFGETLMRYWILWQLVTLLGLNITSTTSRPTPRKLRRTFKESTRRFF
jgi:uncharacterized membrane protein